MGSQREQAFSCFTQMHDDVLMEFTKLLVIAKISKFAGIGVAVHKIELKIVLSEVQMEKQMVLYPCWCNGKYLLYK